MKKASIIAILLLCLACTSISFGQGPFQQSKPSAADQEKLTKLEKAYKAAKIRLAKAPHDAKAKSDFASIGAAYGHESMLSPALAPRVKYPQALRIYREVLKIDPNQPTAKKESELIISIYKQMGRPVPQG
jgi:tetratricopeptide (TPR) repeat protein